MNTKQLSPDELRTVEAAISTFTKQAKFPLTLDILLQRWERFADQIEGGYTDSIYEYTNDLTTRDIFHQVLLVLPDPIKSKLTALVKVIDDKFDRITQPIGRGLLKGKHFDQQPWWFRVPKEMSKELEDDLRSEKLIQ